MNAVLHIDHVLGVVRRECDQLRLIRQQYDCIVAEMTFNAVIFGLQIDEQQWLCRCQLECDVSAVGLVGNVRDGQGIRRRFLKFE